MNYVIIGNSTAAVGAVEGIRQVDSEGSITIISSEPYHTYSRPLISYLLLGKTDEERMKYRPADFYEKNHCTLFLGKRAQSVDSTAKKVLLEDGTQIPYDKLLIATGSTPLIPPMSGLETVKEKYTFLSLDDAKALQASLREAKKRVLIIGAGLIGLKCAEGIAHMTESLTVVDLSDHILSSILDSACAEIVQQKIESHGIQFLLGQSVQSFENNTALLSTGEQIAFDVLVLAVGVRPNTALAKSAGAAVNRGIVCNESQQTSVADIYAAGDCCESHDISSETDRILALLPNAYMQGECAGINMAGSCAQFTQAIPMNAIGFWDLHIVTAGSYTGELYQTISEDGAIKKLYCQDNLLKGYILIGNVENAGIYTSLIRNKTPLDTIDFELIAEKPSLMAFSKKFRYKKLGGVV